MFKILVMQTLYTLSDDETEFQIRDRLSFMRFLRLGLEDPVPDATTIWLFREQLSRAGAVADLFADFDAWVKGRDYLAMSGQIVDASIIAAPRQMNTDAEKAALKDGRIPKDWAGTVRISVCGRRVENQAAIALSKRSPKITANWALWPAALEVVPPGVWVFSPFGGRTDGDEAA